MYLFAYIDWCLKYLSGKNALTVYVLDTDHIGTYYPTYFVYDIGMSHFLLV